MLLILKQGLMQVKFLTLLLIFSSFFLPSMLCDYPDLFMKAIKKLLYFRIEKWKVEHIQLLLSTKTEYTILLELAPSLYA